MRSVRNFETLDRSKAPLNATPGRHMDADGQQSDSGRGASDEDLSATLAQHAAACQVSTFHPGCPATTSSAGTLRTRHLVAGGNSFVAGGSATLPGRQLASVRQCTSPGGDYTRPGSAMGGANSSDSYEMLRQKTPQLQNKSGTVGTTPGGPPAAAGSRVDAEQLVEEIDQLFFKDMML